MTTRAQYRNNVLVTYEDSTGEIIAPSDPVWFYDDFIGAGHTVIPTTASAGSFWGSKIVKTSGSPTVAALANGINGQIQIYTDATNEKQDAVFYALDQCAYGIPQALKYETRVQLSVIPTSGTKAVFGMGTAWVDGQNNIAKYARFAVNGNGTLLCELQDGTTQVSVSTGITIATTTEWHLLRIDLSVPSNVQFFVDGNQVLTTTVFSFAATGVAMQPYASVYKATGTSVGTVNLDFISISSARS